MILLTARQMAELDRRTIEEGGVPGVVLMENAGRAVAEHVARRHGDAFPGPVLILCGKGNNGGDGYVVARHLEAAGWAVRCVVLADRDQIGGDAGVNLEILRRAGSDLAFAADDEALDACLQSLPPCSVVVDALFGTGLASEVRGHYRRAIDWVNAAEAPVVAVDIPSGVAADSGRILGRAVRAASTVTFAFAKPGLLIHPGQEHVGALEVAPIGMPLDLTDRVSDALRFVDRAEAACLLPPRPGAGHKGTFGHLLVVAGSRGKTGAAALSALGGMRSGAGLVTLAVPASQQPVLAARLTEVMTAELFESAGGVCEQALDQVRELWAGKEALALGPGLGTDRETVRFVRKLVGECPLPLVVDADGLNSLAGDLALLDGREATTVLTPHPGEMARLTGASVAEIEADRLGAARTLAERHRVVVVLKGARTVTALPDGQLRINASGNPGMASGGMGDVLTGMIGGLLAQGMDAGDAAVLGVFLHGLAGDRLAGRLGAAGLLATDLLREVPAARNELQSEV